MRADPHRPHFWVKWRLRRGGEGGNPAEAFAKGGDSDERRCYLPQVSERYNTCFKQQRPLPKIIAAG